MFHDLLSILACPGCGAGSLSAAGPDPARLRCGSCAAEVPVRNRVPDFTGGPAAAGGRWTEWEDHLEGFADRRRQRVRKPNPSKLKRWQRKERAFLDFIDPRPGRVLDVGCGPGSLRKGLPSAVFPYTGLDPLAPEAPPEFDLVCGLAEALPFRDGMFSAVVVRSALDHFCEPDRFFEEAGRVLTPGGSLFIEQAVHERRGGLGLCRWAAHATQDALDRMRHPRAADKHMHEFTREQVLKLIPPDRFRSRATRLYSPPPLPDLLAAEQWFVALERVA